MNFMPDRFQTESPSIFSCLLLSHIFALVYLLGNLTVESQDRKRSSHHVKYPSIDFQSYPTQNRVKELGLVNDVCRIEF